MKKKFFSAVVSIFLIVFVYCANAKSIQQEILSSKTEHSTLAAHVYFSNQVPVAGIAAEGKEFDIDPANGSFVYLVIDNYPNNFTYSQIRMKAYRTVDGVKQEYDDKTYDINMTLSYTYIKYSFYKDGYYDFDVYDKSGNLIGSASCTIYYKKASSQTTTTSSTDPYSGSRVYFSTQAPIGTDFVKDVKVFDIKHSGGYVYVITDNYPNYFTIKSVKLYVYKKEHGDYKETDIQTYNMKENFHDYLFYFTYTFRDKGEYKFVVYDELNRYINTGYVTIKFKGLF